MPEVPAISIEFRRCTRAGRLQAKPPAEIGHCAFVRLQCRRESCRPGGSGHRSRWPYLPTPATGRPYAHWRQRWKSACPATRARSHRRFPIPALQRALFFQPMNWLLVVLFFSDLWTFILLRKWVDDTGRCPRLPPGAFLSQITKLVKSLIPSRSVPHLQRFGASTKNSEVRTQDFLYSPTQESSIGGQQQPISDRTECEGEMPGFLGACARGEALSAGLATRLRLFACAVGDLRRARPICGDMLSGCKLDVGGRQHGTGTAGRRSQHQGCLHASVGGNLAAEFVPGRRWQDTNRTGGVAAGTPRLD